MGINLRECRTQCSSTGVLRCRGMGSRDSDLTSMRARPPLTRKASLPPVPERARACPSPLPFSGSCPRQAGRSKSLVMSPSMEEIPEKVDGAKGIRWIRCIS